MSDSSSDSDRGAARHVCPQCDKAYPSANSLAQHRRLYCRPQRDGTCADCGRSFATFAGLQQHRRKAHPALYQAEMEARDTRMRGPISRLEAYEVARAEVEHQGSTPINKHLAARLHRPIDEIRRMRKRREYLQIRSRLEREHEAIETPLPVDDDPPLDPLPASPLPPPLAGPSTSRDEPVPSPSRAMRRRLRPRPAGRPSPPRGSPGSDSSSSPPRRSSPAPGRTSSAPAQPPGAQTSSCGPDSPASPPSPPGSPDLFPEAVGDEDPPDPVRDYLSNLMSDSDTPDNLIHLIQLSLSHDDVTAHGAVDDLHRLLLPAPPAGGRGPRTASRSRTPGAAPPVRQRRAHRYKRYQELYTKDRSSLAHLIAQGLEPGDLTSGPSAETIAEHYLDVFAGAAPDDPQELPFVKPAVPGLYGPIEEPTIRAAIDDRRISNAAGPDGMTTAGLRRVPLRGVAVLFNAMLMTGHIPTSLKACRTTLIPKSGGDLDDIGSWRPITVANVLLRVLHRILAARLSCLDVHSTQRGFRSLDGTIANSVLLQAAVREARDTCRPYVVSSLDLRKAFDTVPHASVRRALRRFSIDDRLARFLMSGLTGCSTTISAPGATTAEIPILRGVKQGDPLSPLLFNMVLDELMEEISHFPTGINIGDSNVSALAYADDLLLLAPSPIDMRALLRHCGDFFHARSMSLNATKCSSLTVKLLPSRKKLYLSSETHYDIDGIPVPQVSAESSFKYLGHRYGFMGVDCPLLDALLAALNNLKRAPLKPHQKLLLLQDYLLPKYLYSLQNPRINKMTLDRADKAVRRFVKGSLHLPLQLSNAALYARRRDGGLGVMCLSARIPEILLGRIERLAASGDPQLLAAINSSHFDRLRSRLRAFTTPFGFGSQQSTRWRARLSASACGAGLPDHCAAPAACGWIRCPPPHWSGGDFVRAVQLRTGVLPTQGGLHNLRAPAAARACRAGCDRVETISHILQRCPATHHARIARHDHAVRVIARACSGRDHGVEIEPSIRTADGRLHRPDLIIRCGNELVVLDVSVSWETPRPLADHYNNKVAIYSTPPMVEELRRRYPGLSITFGAVIAGARGTWCALNDQPLRLLGLDRRVAASIVTGVLLGGISIHREFGARVWAPPGR